MGKRKNKDEEYIKKKIRKLERKLEKLQPEVDSEDSSLLSSPSPLPPPPRSPSPTSPTPLSSTTQPNILLPPTNESIQNDLSHNAEEDLPEELLQALGTEGEETKELGEAIRPELALRWTKITQTGLGKESREAISKKYPSPINFPRAVAPVINAEIAASLSEPSLKRDKRISIRQNLTGKLLTCLGKSLTKVLTGNINSKVLVEEVNDAAKIAAGIYFQDSCSRKIFALAGTNKVVQDAVKTTTTDEFLFGADCAEKIRATQSIQKAGSLLKIKQQARGGHQQLQSHQHQRQRQANQTRLRTRKPTSTRSRPHYRR